MMYCYEISDDETNDSPLQMAVSTVVSLSLIDKAFKPNILAFAATLPTIQIGTGAQKRFRLACASTQSDLILWMAAGGGNWC